VTTRRRERDLDADPLGRALDSAKLIAVAIDEDDPLATQIRVHVGTRRRSRVEESVSTLAHTRFEGRVHTRIVETRKERSCGVRSRGRPTSSVGACYRIQPNDIGARTPKANDVAGACASVHRSADDIAATAVARPDRVRGRG
jgi:hypothetical protein